MAVSVGDVIVEVLGSEPPSAGVALGSEHPSNGLAPGCAWTRPSRTQADGSWRLFDKDSDRRGISLGGQFHEKIGRVVVPLGDVMQLDPLEFVRKLAYLLAVCYHEGAFVGGVLHDLVNDQLRVTRT